MEFGTNNRWLGKTTLNFSSTPLSKMNTIQITVNSTSDYFSKACTLQETEIPHES